MKMVLNPNLVPHSNPPRHNGQGFYYIQQESGATFEASTIPHLIEKVREHRTVNRYPIGAHFEWEVEDWFCNEMPDRCRDREGSPPTVFEMAKSLVKSVSTWIGSGMPICAEEEMVSRLATCSGTGETPRCEFYRGDRGLGLVACGRCGCSGLKLYMKTSKCPAGKWKV